MGTTGYVIGALLAAGSVYQQDQARQDQKKANKERKAIARANALKERRQDVRQARIQRAAAVNQAFTSGGQGSTVTGATGSIQSQLGSNLAFNKSTLRRSENAAGFDQKASDHLGRAGMFETASSFAIQGKGLFGGSGGGSNTTRARHSGTEFKPNKNSLGFDIG